MPSNVHSVELYSNSGFNTVQTVPIENDTTWIIREICSYSSEGPAQIDISDLITNALLYRHTFFATLEALAPDLQLRHLVLAAAPDDPDTGFIVNPYGAHFDLTVSGYILNGVYQRPF